VLLTEKERHSLDHAQESEKNTTEVISDLLLYTEERAMELHNVLTTFVQESGIAEKSAIVAGWSFGSGLIIKLLAHVPKASSSLHKYIKRVILYGAHYLTSCST
jgi:hypothetical protein